MNKKFEKILDKQTMNIIDNIEKFKGEISKKFEILQTTLSK